MVSKTKHLKLSMLMSVIRRRVPDQSGTRLVAPIQQHLEYIRSAC